MDLSKEYRLLHKLAKDYASMSVPQQRAYDERLGAWMLAADITTDESWRKNAAEMRRLWEAER